MLKSAWEDLREGDLAEILDAIEEEVLGKLGNEIFGVNDASIEWTSYEEEEEDEETERLSREYTIDVGGMLYVAGWLEVERNKEDREVRIYFRGGIFMKCRNDKNLTEGELLEAEFDIETKQWEIWC